MLKTRPGRAPLGQLSKPWSEYNEEERNDTLYYGERRKKRVESPRPRPDLYSENGIRLCYNKLHEMTKDNILVQKKDDRIIRICKKCRKARDARNYERQKAKQNKVTDNLCKNKEHEMTPENSRTITTRGRPTVACLECLFRRRRKNQKAWRERQKAMGKK